MASCLPINLLLLLILAFLSFGWKDQYEVLQKSAFPAQCLLSDLILSFTSSKFKSPSCLKIFKSLYVPRVNGPLVQQTSPPNRKHYPVAQTMSLIFMTKSHLRPSLFKWKWLWNLKVQSEVDNCCCCLP